MTARKDPLRLAVIVAVYLSFYIGGDWVLRHAMLWVGGNLAGGVSTLLLTALFANWMALRIYEHRGLDAVGLAINRVSARNLGFGLFGGIGAACAVLGPPLLVGAAHFVPVAEPPTPGTLPFVTMALAAGAAGEEILFRGYAFQILMASVGPFASIVPVGVIFALMHLGNPNPAVLGIVNTAGFGILFGYAFFRTRDLWLPIGLHYGWNLTLPLFGVNVSGLKMVVTDHEMVWTAGGLWSGGEYGPEASVLTSVALVLLWFYVSQAPLRRQVSPLTDPYGESALCEPPPRLPS